MESSVKSKHGDDQEQEKMATSGDQNRREESKDTIPGFCTVCHKPSKERCSACREVKYCGTECQKGDWPAHKLFCQLAYPKKDPDVKSVRAILLPDDSTSPRFVQVPLQLLDNLDIVSRPGYITNHEAFFGKAYTARRMSEYLSDDGSKKRMLTVYFDDCFLMKSKGMRLNECVVAITKGENANYWRGPIIIYDSDDVESIFSEFPEYVDMRKQDCRQIVEFFLEERNRM